jgi:hypothetical protein
MGGKQGIGKGSHPARILHEMMRSLVAILAARAFSALHSITRLLLLTIPFRQKIIGC